MSTLGRLAQTPLERLWSVPYGHDRGTAPLRPSRETPRAAFEAVALEALQREPCVVSFSGGRDSSAVLAIAVAVARREGLSLPVPVTNRFRHVPTAQEDAWQERVVRHLGLQDWVKLALDDDLDMLGAHATRAIVRHGVLPLFNAHFHSPIIAVARGGSLLSGAGGDEIYGTVDREHAAALLFGRQLPRSRAQWRRTVGEMLPPGVRARRRARHLPFGFAWIRPEARRELARDYSSWQADEPLSWRRSLTHWWWPSRRSQCMLAALAALGGDDGVAMHHPFSAARTLAAYAGTVPHAGVQSRTAGLRALAGDLLPAEMIERSTKASFNGAIWGPSAQAFAASWQGEGIDDAWVDQDALRAEWRKDDPDPHSFSLLQTAWLAEQPVDRGQQRVGPGVDR